MKAQIIRELGQSDILLPSLIADGLAANDRIKVRLTALQEAAQHARQPDRGVRDITPECRSAGIAPAELVALIGGARLAGEDRMTAPNLAKFMKEIEDDAAAMVRAVAAGDPAEGVRAKARLESIHAAGLLQEANDIDIGRVARLTAMAQEDENSLHRLIMDLHKALNRLATSCAEAVVAGAHVFGLQPEDRDAVQSFMKGVNETRRLKFNHPGLDTMATRSGGRLLIQNDIGETEAHVVIIAVKNNSVTVTNTDVHLPRVKFFIGLFDEFQVKWSGLDRHAASGLSEDSAFFLVTGQLDAGSTMDRNAFLTAVGASLVFLIDWNRARKLLRNWVTKEDAVRILEWAARNRIGHRAFLELGGNEFLAAAVRSAAPTRLGFGERLDHALGRNAAIDFLKAALRTSTEALLAGQSIRTARDRIEADLVRHLERVDSALLAIVLRQVGLAHDVATAISSYISELQAGRPADGKQLAGRAGQIEQKADRIAIEAREEVSRLHARPIIEQLIDRAEEAIDELEQAAFVASLAPNALDASLLTPLARLCTVAITATEAAASGLAAASAVPEGRSGDSEDALAAVVRLVDSEHAADALERGITALIFAGKYDVATSLSVLELARAIERATDRLSSFGHLLRRYIITDLAA